MKKFFIMMALLGLLLNGLTALAFSEPRAAPPAGNTPGPLNVGSGAQSKAGDLEVNNLTARGGISLGGVFRDSWFGSVGGGCAWEGVKCHCSSDDASLGNISMTVGLTCTAGLLTDFQVMDLQFSSKDKNCSAHAPNGCTAGLYTYSGEVGDRTGFSETISGAVTVVVSVVVRTVRAIGRLFKHWF